MYIKLKSGWKTIFNVKRLLLCEWSFCSEIKAIVGKIKKQYKFSCFLLWYTVLYSLSANFASKGKH